MSGHSHWSGIKHKKAIVDGKRAKVNAKLLNAIAAAARTEANPAFNPRLRTAIDKARAAQVSNDSIERAITRASDKSVALDELTFEAYGPGGAALLIEAVTDNRNRTVQEVKRALNEHGGKWAEVGSVRWAFEPDEAGGSKAKFPQVLAEDDNAKLGTLVGALEDLDDVQRVTTNAT